MKIIILLKTEAQVRDCLSWIDDVNGEMQIIAVTPFAMYELDRKGIEYKIPEDYYNSQELYQMGINNFGKVEDLCAIIDSLIHQADSKVVEHNLKPAMFSFSIFKTLYDSVTIILFQLSNIINKEKPDVIFVYDTEVYPIDAFKSKPFLFFDNRESLWARLLSLNGWKNSIKILPRMTQSEKVFIKNEGNIFNKIKQIAIPLLQTQPKLNDLALKIQRKGLTGLIDWSKNNLHDAKGSPILLYGNGYNWDECSAELKAGGIVPVYRISYDSTWLDRSSGLNLDKMDDVWLELQNNQKFRAFFVFNGIDFFDILKARFEFLVKKTTFACIIAVQETTELITKRNIKALVAATFSTPVGHSVAQAAHNSGIPVVTWQHGGYGAYENHPIVNYFDLINSDAHFVFGDGVVESYIQAAKKYGTELIAIGSSSLENIKNEKVIKKGNNITKKVILYATMEYTENNNCITTTPPVFDTTFMQTQQAVVDVLGKHNDYSVIIKLHPSTKYQEHPLKSYVKDHRFNNFEFIINERTFADLLHIADIVVIDLPCTTILEALALKKYIFAYTGHIYYNEHARELLSRSSICSQELEEFLHKLDKFLTGNVYEPDINNTDFLEMYGTTSKTGIAGERASRELKRIIDNFEHKKKERIYEYTDGLSPVQGI